MTPFEIQIKEILKQYTNLKSADVVAQYLQLDGGTIFIKLKNINSTKVDITLAVSKNNQAKKIIFNDKIKTFQHKLIESNLKNKEVKEIQLLLIQIPLNLWHSLSFEYKAS